MFNYAKSSLNHLKKVHPDLKAVMMEAKNRAEIDFDISCGWRSAKKQQELYSIGRTVDKHKKTVTQLDGIHYKSKHNFLPSLAVDIYAYKKDGSAEFGGHKMEYLAGVIKQAALDLGVEIESGIDWEDFPDPPHYELI